MTEKFDVDLAQIVQQARQLGYVEGRIKMRQSINQVIIDYADLSISELMTASDAFRLILNALMDEDEE